MTNKTLLEMAQDVAVEIRFPAVTSVFGNTDRNVISIFDAIKKGAQRDVFRAHQWSPLLETFNLSGTGDSDYIVTYQLPEDFDSIVSETAWDGVREAPAIGGLTEYEWNGLFYGSDTLYTDRLVFRVRRKEFSAGEGPNTYHQALELAKVGPSESYQFYCSYKRAYYVVEPTTGEPQSGFLTDSDLTVLDSDLIILAATVRMLRSLGRSYGDQMNELTQLIRDARAKDGAVAKRISMNGRGQSDYINTPGYVPRAGRFIRRW